MKQMTCPAAGGPATCTGTLKGSTAEEMMADGMKHVTSAHPEMAADIAKIRSLGANGHLSKPFSTKDLVAAIVNCHPPGATA